MRHTGSSRTPGTLSVKKKTTSDPPNWLTDEIQRHFVNPPLDGTFTASTAANESAAQDPPEASMTAEDSTEPTIINRPTNKAVFCLNVPENEYKFIEWKEQEAKKEDLELMQKAPNLEKAIETLEPQKLKGLVFHFRNIMQGATMSYDHQKATYARIEKEKHYVYHNVRTKACFNTPFRSADYPDLKPLYEKAASALEAANDTYHKSASTATQQGHKVFCFQLRIDRIRTFLAQLIFDLGQCHAMLFREEKKATLGEAESDLSDAEVTKTGIRLLIQRLDLQMLKYLDINRAKLLDIMDAYSPPKYDELNPTDQQAATCVANTILGYIKHATCNHNQHRLANKGLSDAKAKVTAHIEAKQAGRAQAAVNTALQKQNFPQDRKSFNDAVSQEVARQLQNQQQHQQPQQPQPTAKNKSNKKRPPTKAKAPPPKRRKSHPSGNQKLDNNNSHNKNQPNQSKNQGGRQNPTTKATNRSTTPHNNTNKNKKSKKNRRNRRGKN